MITKSYTYGVGRSLTHVMPVLLAFRWQGQPIECGAAFSGTGIWRGKQEECTMVCIEWNQSAQRDGAPRALAYYLRDILTQEAISLSDGTTVEWI